ncbi:hypothetical protein XSR1_30048 [Xenorhabdus szentirmaii DSM 16338]|uniref:Uncharacterized protein n=1 Tax=Xenorhabdus szentirmaii DSM 16338 TaxID=1427518 RepID=W1IZY5_9GAMM|nr:hypothetical protein XSR1_30048 [Xenorhabdus szentirmaii DSM 16338]
MTDVKVTTEKVVRVALASNYQKGSSKSWQRDTLVLKKCANW